MKSWKTFIKQELEKPYLQKIIATLDEWSKTKIIYPKKQDLFACFADFPIDETRVVILGQDPYHTPGYAHGLAFSVVNSKLPPPPSLVNIFKALANDLQIIRTNTNLSDWVDQKVLLLNTILSVNANEPLSHNQLGYEELIQHVFGALRHTKHVVYLLWGKNAQAYLPFINQTENLVIQSSHPSPLSAFRSFLGTKHFSTANEYLIKHKKGFIKW
ncbi:uracil-DNA glycosylase [Ureaplasma sp. ES3154-GEN]|uniref:uracil-DNA glycosylase n=1 Tax=Ureaplasma sp. ES3154-GEN TaxID=2984844 RepID=UPI0021E999E7|nr:uracil-DNA glycosylase [Ureaplasma sp. ES3154-GEN]MCV3743728.1 uracil-DNA glycosylase [Ureaplasma sp. ES3154-GEN]